MNKKMTAVEAAMAYFARHDAGMSFLQTVDMDPDEIGGFYVCGPTTGGWLSANNLEVVARVLVGGVIGTVEVAQPRNVITQVLTKPVPTSQHGNQEMIAAFEGGEEVSLDTWFDDERGPAVADPTGMTMLEYQRRRDAWMRSWVQSWR